MKTSPALVAATLALMPALGAAQGNLNDARAAVRKGTTEGIVLIPARKAAEPAPAASAAASTTAAGGGAAPPGSAPASKPSIFSGLLENIRLTNPPSGQSMQAAKRDESAARGIALPIAASASRPASAPR
jgi:hypothetical protein